MDTLIPDLANAASVTLIIHGVGSASDERLLAAAGKGYAASGLEGRLEPLTLAECPVLSRRQKGAKGLVLQTAGGAHFLIALQWADRRIRLAAIARWSAITLAVLTALAAGGFLFREPLDALSNWLHSWTHFILAYGYILMFSFGWSVYARAKNKRQFHAPSAFILTLPLLLSLIRTEFLDATWLWIPIALLPTNSNHLGYRRRELSNTT